MTPAYPTKKATGGMSDGEVQEQILMFVLLATLVGATFLFMFAQIMRWTHRAQIAIYATAMWPIIFTLGIWPLRRVRPWLACVGYLVLVLTIFAISGRGEVLTLLCVPVALTTILIGPNQGTGLCAVLTLGILVGRSPDVPLDPVQGVIALATIWMTLGILWFLLRHTSEVTTKTLASYASMRTLLEEARDQRVQLKQMQADLMQSNLELARLADRLSAMRRAAEDARRTKEEFVANVSHELRTPLNMVLGFSEMILTSPHAYGQPLPPALLADLRVIYRNSQHLSSLIDDILDLSQLEVGRWALTKERVSVSTIIEEATIAVGPLFRSKGLYLRIHLGDDLPLLYCDRTRIRAVFLNLLSNAGRFTMTGGVVITAYQEADDIVVGVADTGPGIAPEDQARIFRPFEQLDSSARRKHGGSGLGLAISKGFVEIHGGRMWVESQVGVGTTFYFRLPMVAPLETDAGFQRWFQPYVNTPSRERGTAMPMLMPRRRYVICERKANLERLLQRYASEVETVSLPDVEGAMEELRAHSADALLVNGASPEDMSALRQGRGLPLGTPAILFSSLTMTELGTELDVSDYLIKPVTASHLLGTMEAVAPTGGTILVVDDEPDALQLFQRILVSCKHPYRVLRASNVSEALRILDREQPDAIVLDLVMPEMDGFRFLEMRREDARLRRIPVVITSALDPTRRPIMGHDVTLIQGGGLSVAQWLACIDALVSIASPTGPLARRAPPGTLAE